MIGPLRAQLRLRRARVARVSRSGASFCDAAGTISLAEVAGVVELRVMEPSVLHFALHGGELSG